ncbi:hypothetical protein P5G62_028435 [Neobacillus sp. 179-C4.2 HS]|uniref:Uncharacterized protein n=1 Tax=Neobacillus driksii TaxID=3035913 RepID=A0ABV4Z401_9BACI|nr:hypothetical protein [Neobacillus sp. 179.-C4.2 HS]MDP5195214.1 hypothetical protein [Neobacillus sp. 179.-C4.2 HS]
MSIKKVIISSTIIAWEISREQLQSWTLLDLIKRLISEFRFQISRIIAIDVEFNLLKVVQIKRLINK